MASRLGGIAALFLAACVAVPLRAADLGPVESPFVHVTGANDLALEDTGQVTPLRLFIFLHDGLNRPELNSDGGDPLLFHEWIDDERPPGDTLVADIHRGFVGWWLDGLRQLLPGEPIRVTYLSAMPGITDIPQGHPGVLMDFASALDLHGGRYGLPVHRTYRNKFILLVPDTLGPFIAGRAYREGGEAVASLAGPWTIVAHEAGHLLGALHDESEVRYTGWWWCQTTMAAAPSSILGNCYDYSAANQRRILDHYHLGPGRPTAQPRVADEPVDD